MGSVVEDNVEDNEFTDLLLVWGPHLALLGRPRGIRDQTRGFPVLNI